MVEHQRRQHDGVVAPADGQPVEADPEQEYEEQGEPEVGEPGQDDEQGREETVELATPEPGAHQADAGPQDERQDVGDAHEAECPREGLQYLPCDRIGEERLRDAEVAGGRVAQVLPIHRVTTKKPVRRTR